MLFKVTQHLQFIKRTRWLSKPENKNIFNYPTPPFQVTWLEVAGEVAAVSRIVVGEHEPGQPHMPPQIIAQDINDFLGALGARRVETHVTMEQVHAG